MSTGSLDTATPSPPTFPPTNGHSTATATPPSSTSSNNLKYGTLVPNRVFVGGISSSTTEVDLHKLFSTFGNVKATKIISDRGGCSKGYGFVTFETEEEAKKLQAEADNIILKERKLNIAPAIKKQQPFARNYEMGQPVMNGTIYYHNGVPYTYQNGVAVFCGSPNGALEALGSPGGVTATTHLQQPFLFHHHQQQQHQQQQQQMFLPGGTAAAATAALLSATQPHFFAPQQQLTQQQVAAALQQQAANSPLIPTSSSIVTSPTNNTTPSWQPRWITNGGGGTTTPTPTAGGANGHHVSIPQNFVGSPDHHQPQPQPQDNNSPWTATAPYPMMYTPTNNFGAGFFNSPGHFTPQGFFSASSSSTPTINPDGSLWFPSNNNNNNFGFQSPDSGYLGGNGSLSMNEVNLTPQQLQKNHNSSREESDSVFLDKEEEEENTNSAENIKKADGNNKSLNVTKDEQNIVSSPPPALMPAFLNPNFPTLPPPPNTPVGLASFNNGNTPIFIPSFNDGAWLNSGVGSPRNFSHSTSAGNLPSLISVPPPSLMQQSNKNNRHYGSYETMPNSKNFGNKNLGWYDNSHNSGYKKSNHKSGNAGRAQQQEVIGNGTGNSNDVNSGNGNGCRARAFGKFWFDSPAHKRYNNGNSGGRFNYNQHQDNSYHNNEYKWFNNNSYQKNKNMNNYGGRKNSSGDGRKFSQGFSKDSQPVGICHVCPIHSPARNKPHFHSKTTNAIISGNSAGTSNHKQNGNPAPVLTPNETKEE